jgi:hypothetical protein
MFSTYYWILPLSRWDEVNEIYGVSTLFGKELGREMVVDLEAGRLDEHGMKTLMEVEGARGHQIVDRTVFGIAHLTLSLTLSLNIKESQYCYPTVFWRGV